MYGFFELPEFGSLWGDSNAVVTPEVPLAELSRVYFDNTDAAVGPITTFTTRGTSPSTFTDAALTGGAAPVWTAQGLETRGNILRHISTSGPYSKVRIAFEATRTGISSARGSIITLNLNAQADQRMLIDYTAGGFIITGPNATVLNLPAVWGYNSRQTIAVEWDFVAGLMTVMEPDGDTQSVAIAAIPLGITRIEIGKGALATIHELSIVTEA